MAKTCAVCREPFADDTSLHRHLRAHKITQAKYYHLYFPRYDMFDGQLIEFKSADFYFNADFNSRTNLKSWLLQASREEAQTYLRGWLKHRQGRKTLRFAPTQVELRSLPTAGMLYMNELFGNYYEVCEELGFELKYRELGWNTPPKRFQQRHHILCDTREQQPLTFPTLVRNYEALKFGDYRLNDDDFTHNCCIERKSLNDFYSTLSFGFARFTKEIERTDEAGFFLVTVIESPFNSVYDHTIRLQRIWKEQQAQKVTQTVSDPADDAEKERLYPPASAELVFFRMRLLLQKYPNLQFLFVKNREEAARAIERIFQSDGEYKKVDLQFLYDSGKFF